LVTTSDDERITLQTLNNVTFNQNIASRKPDLLVSVIDINQAARHLIHVLQLKQQGYNSIVVINYYEAEPIGSLIDLNTLKEWLAIPVYCINAHSSQDVQQLTEALVAFNYNKKYVLPLLPIEPPRGLYNKIENALRHARYTPTQTVRFDWDTLFLHPLLGPLLFLGVMAFFFYSIFAFSAPFMDVIEWGVGAVHAGVTAILPAHFLTTLLTEGIINGIGAVLVFVPQIACLFLGIGLMESTGYLARGAVIIDRPLALIGLNGRCFVPLLSGFACSIPALLATRHIQQEKVKKICCFIIPLMQCSARLPVYGLLLGLLFGQDALKSALALTGIYAGSLLLGALVAVCIAPFVKGSVNRQFNIELPAWRLPYLKPIWQQVVKQTHSFIAGAGPLILVIAILLWIIDTYPHPEASFAMKIGQFIEPLFLPMGVDWRVGVAILLSFAAREVFVSALAVMFRFSGSDTSLATVLTDASIASTNTPVFTVASMTALIIFFMVAMQCGATVAVVRKEMKSTMFSVVQLGVYIGLAYGMAVVTFQLLSL